MDHQLKDPGLSWECALFSYVVVLVIVLGLVFAVVKGWF